MTLEDIMQEILDLVNKITNDPCDGGFPIGGTLPPEAEPQVWIAVNLLLNAKHCLEIAQAQKTRAIAEEQRAGRRW